MSKIQKYSFILSFREYEVLKLIAEGYSSKQIAFKLHIAEVTVVYHRQNLKQKLDVKNSMELISKAFNLKILG